MFVDDGIDVWDGVRIVDTIDDFTHYVEQSNPKVNRSRNPIRYNVVGQQCSVLLSKNCTILHNKEMKLVMQEKKKLGSLISHCWTT